MFELSDLIIFLYAFFILVIVLQAISLVHENQFISLDSLIIHIYFGIGDFVDMVWSFSSQNTSTGAYQVFDLIILLFKCAYMVCLLCGYMVY
jgi:hypothetical protein